MMGSESVSNSVITEKDSMAKGVHILGEFFNCKNEKVLIDKATLRKSLIAAVNGAGLTYLTDSFYKFGSAGGVTGVIVLSESHVAFHTWPERDNYVSLDVFTCNYCSDNTGKANRLYQSLVDLFQPDKIDTVTLRRG